MTARPTKIDKGTAISQWDTYRAHFNKQASPKKDTFVKELLENSNLRFVEVYWTKSDWPKAVKNATAQLERDLKTRQDHRKSPKSRKPLDETQVAYILYCFTQKKKL